MLALQAREAPGVSVISHELFCAADAGQAERAVRSLRPAEVHVVLTVRDMGSLLPAEWQETVKHRNDRTWTDWLHDVIDTESVAPDAPADSTPAETTPAETTPVESMAPDTVPAETDPVETDAPTTTVASRIKALKPATSARTS